MSVMFDGLADGRVAGVELASPQFEIDGLPERGESCFDEIITQQPSSPSS